MIALYLFVCIVLYTSTAQAALTDTYYPENRTDVFRFNGNTVFTVQTVSIYDDITTFQETINITAVAPFPVSDNMVWHWTKYAGTYNLSNVTVDGVPSSYTVGQSYIVTMTATKQAELGVTSIHLYPSFLGFDLMNHTWFNTSWKTAKFFGFSYPGIYNVNMSNSTGNDNSTYIFLNGLSALVNQTDIRVLLNDSVSVPHWFDNDTSQSGTNVVLWWNQTAQGNISLYYANSGANVSADYNLTKVMNYADGWNGYWNYTYTMGGGGALQSWGTRPNGTMMQINPALGTNKNFGFTQTTFPAGYEVVTKMKYMTAPSSGRGGVQLGRDATHDIGAGLCAVFATQNCIVQDNLAFGTAGTNSKTLVATEYFMVYGYTTGAAEQSKILSVNQPDQTWQGSGAFTSSTTKRIGLYSPLDAAAAYQYLYAWNGTVLNAGTPIITLNYSVVTVNSWSNNLTNDASLSIGTYVPKIIMFNASLSDRCDNCTWTVNGAKVTNTTILKETSMNYSFVSSGIYLVNLTAYNNTFGTTGYINWTVTMSILTVANLDGFVNNTPLGVYVDAVRVDLLNTSGTGSNFTTFSRTQYLPNATNLAPTIDPDTPGTGERVDNVTYYSNYTDIEVIAYAHAMNVADTARVFFYLNDVLVCTESGRPLGAAEEAYRACTMIVPQGAFYRVDFSNFHHYFWTEQRLIRGYYNFSSVPTGNYSLLFRQVAYDNLTVPITLTSNMRYNATISPTIDDDGSIYNIAFLGFILGLIAMALIVKHKKRLRHDGVN